MSGGNWTGQPRDGAQPHRLVSPYDRKPVRSTTQAADLPGGDDRLPVNLASWCGWVVVEDDGGADLIVRSGRAGNDPTSSPTGSAVWIGDGQCSISYGTAAPTRTVRLVGCTGEDAAILAAGALAAAVAALTAVSSAKAPNGTTIENVVLNGSEQDYTPPVGTLWSVVSANASTVSPCTVKSAGAGSTSVGGNSANSAVTIYGDATIKVSGATAETIDIINYTRT